VVLVLDICIDGTRSSHELTTINDPEMDGTRLSRLDSV